MQSSINLQIILLRVLCFAMQIKQHIYYLCKKNVRSISYNEQCDHVCIRYIRNITRNDTIYGI